MANNFSTCSHVYKDVSVGDQKSTKIGLFPVKYVTITVQVHDQRVAVQCSETSGHEKYRYLTPGYCLGAHMVFLCVCTHALDTIQRFKEARVQAAHENAPNTPANSLLFLRGHTWTSYASKRTTAQIRVQIAPKTSRIADSLAISQSLNASTVDLLGKLLRTSRTTASPCSMCCGTING